MVGHTCNFRTAQVEVGLVILLLCSEPEAGQGFMTAWLMQNKQKLLNKRVIKLMDLKSTGYNFGGPGWQENLLGAVHPLPDCR